jgi:hypothetical protein
MVKMYIGSELSFKTVGPSGLDSCMQSGSIAITLRLCINYCAESESIKKNNLDLCQLVTVISPPSHQILSSSMKIR